MEKDRELKPRAKTSHLGRRRAEPSLELHLEPGDLRWDAEDQVGSISRESLALALIEHARVSAAGDEWIADEDGLRVYSTGARVVVEIEVRAEDREALSLRIDHAYDLAFDIARELRLDVFDSQVQQVVTPLRYESLFPRILDSSHRRARILDALRSRDGWRHCDSAPLPDRVALVSAELSALPASVWSKVGKPIGVLELEGEEVGSALRHLRSPFLAFGFGDGGPVAVVRIVRFATPVPGVHLVDVVSGGMHAATESLSESGRIAVLRST